MRVLKIAFITFFLLRVELVYSGCSAYDKIKQSGLFNDQNFWEFVSKKGVLDDKNVNEIIDEYKKVHPTVASTTQVVSANTTMSTSSGFKTISTQNVTIKKAAEKSYAIAPANVQKKADEVVRMFEERGASTIHDLKKGNWHYEYIREKKHYAVRLNEGFRMLFDYDNGKLTIFDISKHAYHH